MKAQESRIQVRSLQYNTQTSGKGGQKGKGTEDRAEKTTELGKFISGITKAPRQPLVTQYRISCSSPNHRSWSDLYVYEAYLPVCINNLNRLNKKSEALNILSILRATNTSRTITPNLVELNHSGLVLDFVSTIIQFIEM